MILATKISNVAYESLQLSVYVGLDLNIAHLCFLRR